MRAIPRLVLVGRDGRILDGRISIDDLPRRLESALPGRTGSNLQHPWKR